MPTRPGLLPRLLLQASAGKCCAGTAIEARAECLSGTEGRFANLLENAKVQRLIG